MINSTSLPFPLQQSNGTFCPAIFDNLCWPQTPANQSVTISCSPLAMQGVDATSWTQRFPFERRQWQNHLSFRIDHSTMFRNRSMVTGLLSTVCLSRCVGFNDEILYFQNSSTKKSLCQKRDEMKPFTISSSLGLYWNSSSHTDYRISGIVSIIRLRSPVTPDFLRIQVELTNE